MFDLNRVKTRRGRKQDVVRNPLAGCPQPGVFLKYSTRFCETCKSRKPIKFLGGYGQIRPMEKAFKGWKCDDCKKAPNAK